MMPSNDVTLGDLFDIFGKPSSIVPLSGGSVPEPYHSLLVHPHHMTATLETFWNSRIAVHVINSWQDKDSYTRLIYLTETKQNRTVEYGAVNLNLSACEPAVRNAILDRQTPLGRILIDNGVLTEIRCRCFFAMKPTAEQQKTFNIASDGVLYGRFADVDFNGENAMTLLEVMPPDMESLA
jgi:hypothetical protein